MKALLCFLVVVLFNFVPVLVQATDVGTGAIGHPECINIDSTFFLLTIPFILTVDSLGIYRMDCQLESRGYKDTGEEVVVSWPHFIIGDQIEQFSTDEMANSFVIGRGLNYPFWTEEANPKRTGHAGIILSGTAIKINKIENGWWYFELTVLVKNMEDLLELGILAPDVDLYSHNEFVEIEYGVEKDFLFVPSRKVAEIHHAMKIEKSSVADDEIILKGKFRPNIPVH